MDLSYRLKPLEMLSHEYGVDVDVDGLMEFENSAHEVRSRTGCLPTIGCEVEIKWSSIFPDIALEYFGEPDKYGKYSTRYVDLSKDRQNELDSLCKELDEEMKPRYEATLEAGIPVGDDAYWEFANSPTFSYRTLSKEVDLLKSGGLIPAGQNHSLHVTLGDLSTKGGGVSLILTALEVMYANPTRIEEAVFANRFGGASSWARRGRDGVRSRHVNDLALDAVEACELRTLSVRDESNVDDIFGFSQLFGAVLLGYRIRSHRSTEMANDLSLLWPKIRSLSREAILSADLPYESWGMPHRNKQKWMTWAEYISHRDHPDSHVGDIITELKSIEDKARQIIDL